MSIILKEDSSFDLKAKYSYKNIHTNKYPFKLYLPYKQANTDNKQTILILSMLILSMLILSITIQ